MQVNVSFTRARSAILAAGGLLCLITLSGCAGGGGGGGLSTLPSPFVYPKLTDATPSDTTVDGFISPYALNATTLTSTTPSVSGTSPSKGIITINVDTIELPDGTSEPAFSVQFDPSASTASLSNSPFGSSYLSPACTDCLKTATAAASDSSTVVFTYLDPSVFLLNYSVLGIWEKPTNVSSVWPYVGGAFSAGVLTRGIDLPTTGSGVNYSGYFIGRYVTSATAGATGTLANPGTYLVGANASATADFAARTVSFSTTNTHIALDSGGSLGTTPIPVSGLDLNAAMTINSASYTSSTSNSFGGTATTSSVSAGLSGPIQGGFYGPPATSGDFAPPELGGSLSVTNSLKDQSMAGSFALKK